MDNPQDNDVGDVKTVKKGKTKAALRREREIEELRQLLATREGRATLWRLLQHCGIFRTSFDADSHTTAFNEGGRNIGLWMIGEIDEANVHAYEIMRNEAVNQEGTDNV